MDAELVKLNSKLLQSGRLKISTDAYALLKSDDERFSFTLSLLEDYKITPNIKSAKKNSALSVNYRKAGNNLFVSADSTKKRDEILELYTKSVAFAELKSRELALAYGNRSALFFDARLYDHCLVDIERALSLDYPQHLRSKLMIRRINCLHAMGGKAGEKIDEAVEEARRCIEAASLEEDKDSKKLQTITTQLTNSVKFPAQRKLFDERKYSPEKPDGNSEIPGASAALEIAYDEQFGRHIKATRKIYPGELLSIQSGYATILAPENLYTHCSNCLSQTWSAVPCNNCPQVVYCNEMCRDAAWKNHHDVECRVIGALLNLDFNLLTLMSLRLVIRAVKEAGGFQSLKTKLEAVDACHDPRTRGFTGTPPILDETDYSSVYTLAKNTEYRSNADLFGRSFNAVYVVYCVGALSNFFGEKFSRDIRSVRKNPWSIFVGGLITRHQQIIPSNVHGVSETVGLFDRERGASIIPFLSLFNHSCDCMVVRVHFGPDIALYAVHTIEAGEQVYDNYGMHYAMESIDARQRKLKRQFYFTCVCRPCTERWPLFSNIPSWMHKPLDVQPQLKLKKALKDLDKYVAIATVGEVEDKLYIIKELELMIKILFECVVLPCREVNEVVETLKRMYHLISLQRQSLSKSV